MEAIRSVYYLKINFTEVNDVENQTKTISLGKPITAPCLVPVIHAATPNCINEPFMLNGDIHKVTAISLGTPHGAVIVNDIEKVDVPALGKELGTHRLFPEGANIAFVQLIDGETVKARFWKRNEGEVDYTLESVGVAATVVMMLQRVKLNLCKVIVLSGTVTFTVEWDRIGEVMLTGSADLML
jgi:diaminopimelate epimerase